jgi:hypothetical protein
MPQLAQLGRSRFKRLKVAPRIRTQVAGDFSRAFTEGGRFQDGPQSKFVEHLDFKCQGDLGRGGTPANFVDESLKELENSRQGSVGFRDLLEKRCSVTGPLQTNDLLSKGHAIVQEARFPEHMEIGSPAPDERELRGEEQVELSAER